MTGSVDQRLVVVTPVYEDVEASGLLFKELRSEFGAGVYVVAVDDGSVKQSLDAHSLSGAELQGVVIRLRRNVGHQRAIAVGINYVAEHFPAAKVVVMDSDGEDLPKSITTLMTQLDAADVDIVVAQRKNRVESWRFRAFYLTYKWLFMFLTGRKIGFGNFMALKPEAVARVAAMHELWTHLAACVLTSRLRLAFCPMDRGPRYAGQSKMNFVGLALHGFRALMVFAEDVLVRVGIACTILAGLSILGAVAAIILKSIGFATPGWFSVALGILLLVFLQTAALTLMLLMLTGVVRGGMVGRHAYEDLVESYSHARPAGG